MADSTTERKIALVVGPPEWGDPYLTRKGSPTPIRQKEVRAHRRVEAADEVRGLTDRLDRLPDDCLLMLVAGSGGASHRAATWAEGAGRQTIAVPVVDGSPEVAMDLAVELVVTLAEGGVKIATFVCAATEDDPALAALAARGLAVWPILPLAAPKPEPLPEGDKPKRARKAKAEEAPAADGPATAPVAVTTVTTSLGTEGSGLVTDGG